MKSLLVASLLLVAVSASLYQAPSKTEFEAWCSKYNKVYSSAEEKLYRFGVFQQNHAKIYRLNADSVDSAEYAINHFADLTHEEFATRYLTPMKATDLPSLPRLDLPLLKDEIPSSWNWVEQGAVTAIKEQGQCGSCWAFSTVANLEGQNFVHGTHKLTPLSEQALVDCDHVCDETGDCDNGCNGGMMNHAFEYVIQNGLPRSVDYPYQAREGQCHSSSFPSAIKITNWTMIDKDEELIKQALYTYGPLSIAVDAEHWSYYSGGIYDSPSCTTNLDHGVALVGYGEENGTPYWIVRNSWSAEWGQSGYMWLKRGENKCGVAEYVCTSLIK